MMLLLLTVVVMIAGALALVVWEERGERLQHKVYPSKVVHQVRRWLEPWQEWLGEWFAKLLSPLYYLDLVWRQIERILRHFKPYYDAVRRIVHAFTPDVMPLYYFFKGFVTTFPHNVVVLCVVWPIWYTWYFSDDIIKINGRDPFIFTMNPWLIANAVMYVIVVVGSVIFHLNTAVELRDRSPKRPRRWEN